MRVNFDDWPKRYGLLALAVTLTLAVRLVYGLLVFERIADRFSWRSDDEYSDIAYTLLTSGKYAVSEDAPPTMKRLPLHPLILAGIYRLFGRSAVAVCIFQSLLCAATCVVILSIHASRISSDTVGSRARSTPSRKRSPIIRLSKTSIGTVTSSSHARGDRPCSMRPAYFPGSSSFFQRVPPSWLCAPAPRPSQSRPCQ